MKIQVQLIVALFAGCSAISEGSAGAMEGASRPVAYLHVEGEESSWDKFAKEHYSAKYRVVSFSSTGGAFEPPKGRPSELPRVTAQGKCVTGSATLFYVIDVSGSVSDIFIWRSSSEPIARAAHETVASWRYAPATLDGKAVSLIVASNLSFPCPEGR